MSTLAEARLEPSERKVLDRWVELLRAELGRDLHEVWLYGSRARGEHTGPESDVDLLVVTSGGARHRRRVTDLLHEAAGDDGPATGGEYPSSPRFVGNMRARTRETLADAREHLSSARVLLAGERHANQAFVEGGRFDPELHQAASSALEKRIGVDYHGVHFDSTEAGRIHHDAERFLTAVEAMLDV